LLARGPDIDHYLGLLGDFRTEIECFHCPRVCECASLLVCVAYFYLKCNQHTHTHTHIHSHTFKGKGVRQNGVGVNEGKRTRERANKTLLATRHFHVASCHYPDTHTLPMKHTHTHTHWREGPGARRMQNCSFIQQHKHCCAHKFIQSSSLHTRAKKGGGPGGKWAEKEGGKLAQLTGRIDIHINRKMCVAVVVAARFLAFFSFSLCIFPSTYCFAEKRVKA